MGRAKAATLFHAPRNEILVDEDGRAGSTEAASQLLVGDSGRAGQARGRDFESHGKPRCQPRAVRHDDQHVLLALMQVEDDRKYLGNISGVTIGTIRKY